MTINEKISCCRKSNGYSQEALAELLGVSRQSVSKWETGEGMPEIGKLLPIANCFHVTTDWLLNDDADFPYTPPAALPLTPAQPSVKESKANQYYKKYGWLIGIAGIVYGLLFSAGIIPFLTGVTQGLKQNGDSAVLKAFLAFPIVVGIVALALITGGVIFLVRYLKKYPRRGNQDEQNSSSG